MGVYTGTVPTFLAGELPDADKYTEISNFMTAATAAWTTWSPTLTNLTLGNGTLTAKYRQLGKTGDLRFDFVLGSTSAVGTNPQFSLPFTLISDIASSGFLLPGLATLVDAGTERRPGAAQVNSSTVISFVQINATPAVASVTATAPWTWTTGDMLLCTLSGLEIA